MPPPSPRPAASLRPSSHPSAPTRSAFHDVIGAWGAASACRAEGSPPLVLALPGCDLPASLLGGNPRGGSWPRERWRAGAGGSSMGAPSGVSNLILVGIADDAAPAGPAVSSRDCRISCPAATSRDVVGSSTTSPSGVWSVTFTGAEGATASEAGSTREGCAGGRASSPREARCSAVNRDDVRAPPPPGMAPYPLVGVMRPRLVTRRSARLWPTTEVGAAPACARALGVHTRD